MFEVTLNLVKSDMAIILSNFSSLVDERAYIFKHIRDFEQLSDKNKMRVRIVNLITVFFEHAIKSVKSLNSKEIEKNFLIQKFSVFDESNFKYFDVEKILSKANVAEQEGEDSELSK